MPDTGFTNLFVVALVAFLAPLTVAMLPRLRVPSVVLEIVAGVVLGPAVLGVVSADLPVQVLAVVGLAFPRHGDDDRRRHRPAQRGDRSLPRRRRDPLGDDLPRHRAHAAPRQP